MYYVHNYSWWIYCADINHYDISVWYWFLSAPSSVYFYKNTDLTLQKNVTLVLVLLMLNFSFVHGYFSFRSLQKPAEYAQIGFLYEYYCLKSWPLQDSHFPLSSPHSTLYLTHTHTHKCTNTHLMQEAFNYCWINAVTTLTPASPASLELPPYILYTPIGTHSLHLYTHWQPHMWTNLLQNAWLTLEMTLSAWLVRFSLTLWLQVWVHHQNIWETENWDSSASLRTAVVHADELMGAAMSK